MVTRQCCGADIRLPDIRLSTLAALATQWCSTLAEHVCFHAAHSPPPLPPPFHTTITRMQSL